MATEHAFVSVEGSDRLGPSAPERDVAQVC